MRERSPSRVGTTLSRSTTRCATREISRLWVTTMTQDRYGDLVEYENGRRRVRGRTTPYEFRSVEQLRYDFENDIAAQAA